eukprot:jgi/Mesen1/9208/ME000591S08523
MYLLKYSYPFYCMHLSKYAGGFQVEMHPLVWSTDDIQQDLTSAEFLSWSRENGVVLSPKIQVALLPDRSYGGTSGSRLRGVVAVDDIALGERLCLLPLALGLYYKRGDNLTAGVEAEGEAEEEAEEGEGEELPGWALAARTLLQERAKQSASRWAPYIASLPPVAPSPLAMDAQEMESIQWAPMIAEARSLKADVRRAYARLGGGPSLASTLEQFEWAVSMVLSRAFTLPVREGEEEEKGEEYEEYVLMPFMDLINHHHDNNVRGPAAAAAAAAAGGGLGVLREARALVDDSVCYRTGELVQQLKRGAWR